MLITVSWSSKSCLSSTNSSKPKDSSFSDRMTKKSSKSSHLSSWNQQIILSLHNLSNSFSVIPIVTQVDFAVCSVCVVCVQCVLCVFSVWCVCCVYSVCVCRPAACLPLLSRGGRTQTSSFWQAFQTLLPSPQCGLADNGNLIGGRAERAAEVGGWGLWVGVGVGGECVVRLLWETLQSAGPPICPLELFVTESSTVILPLLFLGRAIIAPIPLTYPEALCAGTGSGFNFFFFTLFRTVFSSPPPHAVCRVLDHTGSGRSANSPRAHWEHRRPSGGWTAHYCSGFHRSDANTMAPSRAYTSAHSQIPATYIRLVSLHQEPHKCLI